MFQWGRPGMGFPQVPYFTEHDTCLHVDPLACVPQTDQLYTQAEQAFLQNSWEAIGSSLFDMSIGGDPNRVIFTPSAIGNTFGNRFEQHNALGNSPVLTPDLSIGGME